MQTQVALLQCAAYESAQDALARLIDGLGGMKAFVRPGQSVLVKPNLLTDRLPAEAVTTHPEVVRGVIRLLKDAGARPWVADSPCNVAALPAVWEKTGVAAVCRAEDVPLVNLEQAGSVRIEESGVAFTIAKPALEAEAIVNLSKVKTHVLTGLTGAVKNLYGTVPGFQKTVLHKLYPRRDEFADLLVSVYGRVKPALSIADGVVGMEGNGPSGGTPVALGFLAASTDAVALDTVVAGLLGMKIEDVSYLEAARRRGIGETDLGRIRLLGDPPAAVAPRRFRLPDTIPTRHIPRWLSRPVGALVWHRPAFGARCVYCGKCVRACPAGALTQERGQRPVLAADKCIECCCCHEVCPEKAVEMRASPLLRFAAFLKRGR